MTASVPRAGPSLKSRLDAFYDPAAYTKLVRRHIHMGTQDDVEDAIQEAMMRIYARFVDGDHTEPDNLAAFLNTTVRNVLLDRLRAPKVLSESEFEGEDDEGDRPDIWDRNVDQQVGPGLLGRAIEPDEQLAWKQLFHTVLDTLPEKWAEVAGMAMIDASPEEIGAAYGQDGYGLRAYARKLVGRVLAAEAARGDANATALLRALKL